MDLKNYALERLPNTQNVVSEKKWRYRLIDSLLHDWDIVLDIWCASWAFADMRKHKHIQYYGIDYNQYFVDYCNDNWLSAKRCDISKEKIPYHDNTFDFIYCSHVIEHLSSNDQIFFMAEIHRILKKWSKAIFFAPTPYHRYFRDDPTHYRPCTHGQLMALAKDANLKPIVSKYSLLRGFSQNLQKRLRLPPLRWILREVFMIVQKNEQQ